jgi:N-acetylated-alpha-linked acidic dipeptidase
MRAMGCFCIWITCLTVSVLDSLPAPNQPLTGFTAAGAVEELEIEKRFLQLPSPEAFRRHLETITRHPHPAGSEANTRVARYLARVMEEAGLEVERYDYDVYLPELDPEIYVALVTPIRLPLNIQEYILDEDRFSAHPDLRPGWNAFSASGDVTGEMVYANFGRLEDFEKLDELGVSVEGRIVIARYGGNYRGYKVKYAEERGAIGLIIYSDPANGGYMSGPVYPEGKSWSESTVQRGSILTLAYTGDPLTPFLPALPTTGKKKVKRLDPGDVGLPTIPVTPLPYGSAREILKRMRGEPVPSGWQGGLPFDYRLTGDRALTVRLRVDQPKRLVRITNVVGTLVGTEFPDEWIILGSHYDAWSFGAVDPNGGTAMLLTLAEALGKVAGDGHPPRRSIRIAHWDAEEFGIIGSSEWVEQFRDELTEKAVAYINADVSVSGPNFGGASSPSLKSVIAAAARAVTYPGSDEGETVYDRWVPNPVEAVPLGDIGGGSDHLAFYTHVGVPAAGLSMSGASLYHSNYDSFAFFERFCDPDFVYGPTMARIDGILALRLANADIIPYDIPLYAVDLARHTRTLEQRAEKVGLSPLTFDILHAAVATLDTASRALTEALSQSLAAVPPSGKELRRVNKGLIALERAFVRKAGLQGRPWSRSLYASPDPFSGYASWMLPGLRYEIETENAEEIPAWEGVYVAAIKELTDRMRKLTNGLRD